MIWPEEKKKSGDRCSIERLSIRRTLVPPRAIGSGNPEARSVLATLTELFRRRLRYRSLVATPAKTEQDGQNPENPANLGQEQRGGLDGV